MFVVKNKLLSGSSYDFFILSLFSHFLDMCNKYRRVLEYYVQIHGTLKNNSPAKFFSGLLKNQS